MKPGPERFWSVIDNKNCAALETVDKEDAVTQAADWDRLCPQDAPHVVVEYVRADLAKR